MQLIIFFILIINFNGLNGGEMWNFSNLKSNNSEHTALVNRLFKSLNKLETTDTICDTLSDISSNIGNLDNTERIQACGNFYKSAIGQVKKQINKVKDQKVTPQADKDALNAKLNYLNTTYLDELKEKCKSFLKVIEQEKEQLPKKPQETINIKSDIKSHWDLSQIKMTHAFEELKVLLDSFCTDSNDLSPHTTINDQIKNIEKLLNDLNITYNNSTEFGNHKTNTDLQRHKSFKQKYKVLQKELEQFSLDENSVLKDEPDSSEDEEYLSCQDNDFSENEDSVSNKKNTINDCLPPESKKLSALAIIASIENSLTHDQLLTLNKNNQDQLQNKLFLTNLTEHLKNLNVLILILATDCDKEKLNTIQKKLNAILEKISQSTKLEKEQLDHNIHFKIVPNIKNKILLPLKKLCEQLPSVPISINNQSNQAIDSKTITNATTNNTPESHMPANPTLLSQNMANDLLQNISQSDIFSDLNNDKNPLNEKNSTSIPKNNDSKTNKRTWSKPKIIFGIALFSITLYWFLKNYLFSKNPA